MRNLIGLSAGTWATIAMSLAGLVVAGALWLLDAISDHMDRTDARMDQIILRMNTLEARQYAQRPLPPRYRGNP